jgi:predicted aconitase with swiveling domain
MLISAAALTEGHAQGSLALLQEPLSLWGGFDLHTGAIVDATHPQCGLVLAGRILAMRKARGSSSSSSALVEAARVGVAPAAIILEQHDAILVIGALVAADLYGVQIPIVTLPAGEWHKLSDGAVVSVSAGSNQATLQILTRARKASRPAP